MCQVLFDEVVVVLLTEVCLPGEAGWEIEEGSLPGDHAPAFPKDIMGLAMKRVDGRRLV